MRNYDKARMVVLLAKIEQSVLSAMLAVCC